MFGSEKTPSKFEVQFTKLKDFEVGYVLFNYENFEDLGYQKEKQHFFFENGVLKKSDKEFTYKSDVISTITSDSLEIKKDGLYCVAVEYTNDDLGIYELDLLVSNYTGHLVGYLFNLMKFYGYMAFISLVLTAAWGYLTFKYWKEILPVQNYVLLVLFLTTVDFFFRYETWAYFNNNNIYSKFIILMSLIATSTRESVSLFILLTFSLGYGVLKPQLSEMKRVYALTYFHFVSIVIKIIGEHYITNEGTPKLLSTLPASLSYTIFFTWIITALNETVETLYRKGQTIKIEIYRNMTRALSAYFAFSFLFLLATVVIIATSLNDLGWYSRNWKKFWFLLGWSAILYTLGVLTIAYLIRPTRNNQWYGAEQISGDDDLQLEVIIDNTDIPTRINKARSQPTNEEDWADENLGVISDSDDSIHKDLDNLENEK